MKDRILQAGICGLTCMAGFCLVPALCFAVLFLASNLSLIPGAFNFTSTLADFYRGFWEDMTWVVPYIGAVGSLGYYMDYRTNLKGKY